MLKHLNFRLCHAQITCFMNNTEPNRAATHFHEFKLNTTKKIVAYMTLTGMIVITTKQFS